MTESEFLRQIAVAITRREDITNAEARKVLYELALRIYWLLLRNLPATPFERQLRWPEFRRYITLLLLDANDTIYGSLTPQLLAVEAEIAAIVSRYWRLTTPLTPRPAPQLLASTRILATPVEALFTRNSTGLTPFVLQLLRLLERSLTPLFFSSGTEAPTNAEIASRVIGTRTRGGVAVPRVTPGTVASAWDARYSSISAAALWAPVAVTQERASAAGAEIAQWRWNAVLDPRTCPQCRPLHDTTAPAPSVFPYGAPPLHPRCRCIVLPEFV